MKIDDLKYYMMRYKDMSKIEKETILNRRNLKKNLEEKTCTCGCATNDKAYNFLPCEQKRNCLSLIHLNCKKKYLNCLKCSK